jgi:hypothetical protein
VKQDVVNAEQENDKDMQQFQSKADNKRTDQIVEEAGKQNFV